MCMCDSSYMYVYVTLCLFFLFFSLPVSFPLLPSNFLSPSLLPSPSPPLLPREYEWIVVKLQQMVSQADDCTKGEVRFVESYPLSTLVQMEEADLLK